ncbi:MAG: type II secretion system protein GspC [Desulfobacterales bacterium]
MEIIDWRAQNSKILVLVNILLGIVLFIFILIFARNIVTKVYTSRNAKAPVFSQDATTKYGRKNPQEYEAILKNNPFGFQAGPLKPLTGLSDEALPVFDMKLIGTISDSALYSYAVFLGKDGKQEIFKKGDYIFGRGLLKRIEKSRVFIEEGGTLKEIPISDMVVTNKDVAPLSSELSDHVTSFGEGEYLIDQEALQQVLDNPNQVMTGARLIPNMVNNKQEGFILKEVKKGGIYDSMGLKNGDTLLRINDYNISNPANALQAFTALRGMDTVRLDIIRSGVKTTMTYQIR